MLEHLKLQNLGPAAELDFELGERLNVLTGDNGLGKTFVLDLAWWALTRTWADGKVIHPPLTPGKEAVVSYHVHGEKGPNSEVSLTYQRDRMDWPGRKGRPPKPGLIIYARIDGGFSLWDPARNYWRDEQSPEALTDDPSRIARPDSFQFTKEQLWEGLKDEAGKPVCRGLLEDWETWRLKGNGAFAMLSEVLSDLSPVGLGGRDVVLRPGEAVRLPDSGARDIPTLLMPYGSVPITHASAGIRRILSLAYVIVWAWSEHRIAADLRGQARTRRLVLLWDEVEAHLHPQWQRTILPAVVKVLQRRLLMADETELQVVATTHAPLVLASVETMFDANRDRLFNLELNSSGRVELESVPWAKHGDAVEWLRSSVFDMKTGYSREAERALLAAQNWLANRPDQLPEGLKTQETIDRELKRTLPENDPFFPRWLISTGQIQ